MIARLLLTLLVALPLRALPSDLDVGGYVKYLSSGADYPSVDGTLYDQLLHARINGSWYPSSALRMEMDIRARAIYGGSVEKIPGFTDLMQTSYDFTDLDAVLWTADKSFAYAQIDRLWLDYTMNDLELTLGRQRVAWGTALVWNAIDLFNPKSVLDFDYEEKPGVDAFRVQYYTGAVSKIELAAMPAKSAKRSTVAALFETNAFEYDLYGIAGVRDNRWVLGTAWAGSILKGGFRGEVLYSQAPSEAERTVPFYYPGAGSSILASDKNVLSLVLSGDYTFSNSLYVHTECLYSSIGKTDNAGLFQDEALDAGLLSPARWSLYQEFAYDVTPLTRATAFVIWNPNDESRMLVPSISSSLKTDLDLYLVGLFASGGEFSEYGQAGNSIYLRLKYSY